MPTQRSFRLWLPVFAGAVVALIGAAQPVQPDHTPWVARTDHWTISWEEFSRRYETYLMSTGARDNSTLRENVLNSLVNEALLLRNDKEEIGAWRDAHHETAARIRNQAVLAYLKDQEVFARITVSETEARNAFSRSYEQIAARHLYATTESEARELLALVRSGVSFETLARQTFTDSTLRNSGGFLGYFSWGDMDPAFEDAAYQLRVGEVSEPIATASGYSIIRVDDRIPNPLLTENQFLLRRSHVDRVVRMRKRKPAERAYLQSVLPTNEVVFHDEGVRIVALALRRPLPETGRAKDLSGPCVSLPERVVRCDEMIQMLNQLPAAQRIEITSNEALRAAMRGILLQERLLRIAREKGYDTVDVVTQAMRQSEEAMFLRDRVEEIVTHSAVSDGDLRRYYQEHVESFRTENEMQVQELLVGRKELADSLKMLLDRGADLADLARRFSIRRTSGAQGGMLPPAPVSRYGGMRELLWQTPVGSVVGPVPIGDASGIFRVVNRQEGQYRPFDEVKDQVTRMVQFERQRTIVTSYVDEIRRRVPVSIDRPRLMTTPLVTVSPQ